VSGISQSISKIFFQRGVVRSPDPPTYAYDLVRPRPLALMVSWALQCYTRVIQILIPNPRPSNTWCKFDTITLTPCSHWDLRNLQMIFSQTFNAVKISHFTVVLLSPWHHLHGLWFEQYWQPEDKQQNIHRFHLFFIADRVSGDCAIISNHRHYISMLFLYYYDSLCLMNHAQPVHYQICNHPLSRQYAT
jgi:hypothetical protein